MAQTKTVSKVIPFLKWAGGKRDLIPAYTPYLPTSFNRYYEPFFGGGAMFFHLAPDPFRSFLGDANTSLVEVYRTVARYPVLVSVKLNELLALHSELAYYTVRDEIPEFAIDRAARFIYLNRTCFNGLYRENSQGLFNVPVGKYKKISAPSEEDLIAVSQRLLGATILSGDACSLIDQAGSGDFMFVDPPYHKTFCSYNAVRFEEKDHERLADALFGAAGRGAYAMISNSDTEFIRELYSSCHGVHEVSRSGRISAGRDRSKKKELLITIGRRT